MDRLHKTHINEIENLAEKIEDMFSKMDSLLNNLYDYVKKLEHVVEHEPDNAKKFQDAVAYISQGMLMSRLHDEETDLIKLKNSVNFEVHELKEIIAHKVHLEGLQEWQKF